MKSSLFRIALVLMAVMLFSAVLPAFADSGYIMQDPTQGCGYIRPWWEVCPPVTRTRTRTRVVTRQAETMIESIPAEGYCYTAIKRVNVRSKPSIYATKVATIKSAGTEFTVSARAKNSSGEIWYAVLLANSTLGYIRSDLLNTDHVILLGDPYAYEEDEVTKSVPASESASDILNIVTEPDAPAAQPAAPVVTPQVVYVTPAPNDQPTPTPIIVYVTPEPEVTPQIIYVYQE